MENAEREKVRRCGLVEGIEASIKKIENSACFTDSGRGKERYAFLTAATELRGLLVGMLLRRIEEDSDGKNNTN